jgi:PAS domain S-box-containing protein
MESFNADTGFRIKEILAAHPKGLDVSAISRKVGKTRNVVAKYLGILTASGQLEMMKVGTAKLYTLAKRVPISAVLEFSSDYVIVLDEKSTIVQVNTPLLNLLNEPGEALIGKNILNTDNPFLNHIPIRTLSDGVNKTGRHSVEFSDSINGKTFSFSMKQVLTVFEDGGRGQILIFEDISERRRAEEKIRTYLIQQEFFSRKLQEFAELSPEADIYAAIGAGFNELLPDAIIDVNIYDPDSRMLRLKAIFGKGGEEFVRRVGDNHARWDASPAYDSVPEVLGAGTLFTLPGRLHYASFEQLTVEASEAIEKEFDLGDFHSIGLTWRGTILGNILIILRNGGTITNTPLIEIYARAASIALQRQIAEQSVKLKKNNPV